MASESFGSAFTENAEAFGLVGLAWRLNIRGQVVEGVFGSHSREDSTALSVGSVWHWGSCTKALTDTAIACVFDSQWRHKLPNGWNTKVCEIFPELKESALQDVTLLHLAQHRSGIIEDLEKEEEEELYRHISSLSFSEQRRAYVAKIATKPLHHPPGVRYGPYSNGAYVVLAAAVETAISIQWEDIVTQFVTGPLGMKSFGFGCPIDGPIGHDEDDIPQPLYRDKPFLHPAFSVHSTLEDWMKFASVHTGVLRGDLNGSPLCARKESLEFLQIPASHDVVFDGSEPPNGYALGWKTEWTEGEGEGEGNGEKGRKEVECLWHFGTNFRYNSMILIHKKRDIIAVTASNSGSMVARLAMRCAMEKVLEIDGSQTE